MIRIGLTGSIGMGKSTTARLFKQAGCAVWDADEAVHRLYQKGGAAVEPVQRVFPQAIENGAVSRDLLRRVISQDPDALPRIEAIVHPLVAKDRESFATQTTADIIVFDIPLLFEKNLQDEFDKVVCVTVDPATQKNRVLARGGMDEADFERILSHQLPDEEKRKKADYVIVTDTMEHAQKSVDGILDELRMEAKNARDRAGYRNNRARPDAGRSHCRNRRG